MPSAARDAGVTGRVATRQSRATSSREAEEMTIGNRESVSARSLRPRDRDAPTFHHRPLPRPAPEAGSRLEDGVRPPRERGQTAGETTPELFLGIGAVSRLLADALERDDLLDALLASCALEQLLADRARPIETAFRRATRQLNASTHRRIRLLAPAATAIGNLARTAQHDPATRTRIAGVLDAAGRLRDDLAADLLRHDGVPGERRKHAAEARRARGLPLAAAALTLEPALASEVIRVPSCFHSFDQRPADMVRLAEKIATEVERPAHPLSVVGIRTSGSYLAPLLAASLRKAGIVVRDVITLRPGWPLGRMERRRLRASVAGGGLVALVDDPPATGSAFVAALRQLEAEAKVPRSGVLLAFASFEEEFSAPAELADVRCCVLAYSAWEINDLLGDAQLSRLVRTAFPGAARIEALGSQTSGPRGHARRSARVFLDDAHIRADEEVVVEGAGLGFFSLPARTIPLRCPALYPEVLLARDGLIVRRSLPEAERWSRRLPCLSDAHGIAAHLRERHGALPRAADPTEQFSGRQAAREIATEQVVRGLGPWRDALAPLLAGPAVRRLLRPPQPALVDADTGRDRWFVADDGTFRKLNGADGPFSHHDLASSDPFFDVSGVATAVGDPAFAAALRGEYERRSGLESGAARWALLELVHLWNAERLGRLDPLSCRRRRSRVVFQLFADLYLADVPRSTTGAWCAFDLDGVLEGGALGFPSLSTASALALRAALAHGFRPLLVSGRSLEEVRERCEILHLAGGVAEYGAAVYLRGDDRTIDLCPAAARAALARLRAVVAETPGISLDESYARIVRARASRPGGGALGEVRAHELSCRSDAGSLLLAVHGRAQTDFVPRTVDKGRGLRALLAALGEADAPLAFAIGDSDADAPLLAAAARAFAPRHASARLLEGAVTHTRRAYEAGTWEAVGLVIGHRPGACRTCRLPVLSDDTRLLVRLLSLHEAGERGVGPRLALATAAALRGFSRERR